MLAAVPSGVQSATYRAFLTSEAIPYSLSKAPAELGYHHGDLGLVRIFVMETDLPDARRILDDLEGECYTQMDDPAFPGPDDESVDLAGDVLSKESLPLSSLTPALAFALSGALPGGVGAPLSFLLAVFGITFAPLMVWVGVRKLLRHPERRSDRYRWALGGFVFYQLSFLCLALGPDSPSLTFLTCTILAVLLLLNATMARLSTHIDAETLRAAHRVVVQSGRILVLLYLAEWFSRLDVIPALLLDPLEILVALVIMVMPFYGVIRFNVIGSTRLAPILYLRSFANMSGPGAFHLLVAPVALDFGFVVAVREGGHPERALVHDHPSHPRPLLVELTATNWKAGTSKLMEDCSVAIIDITGNTPGVRWELEEALRLLPPQKICVLWNGLEPTDLPSEIESIEYELSPRVYLVESRRNLRAWLVKTFSRMME